MTDGTYKLEIQINDGYESNIYNKGEHVEIKGFVKIKSKYEI